MDTLPTVGLSPAAPIADSPVDVPVAEVPVVEEQVEARRVIEALHAALSSDADELLSAQERTAVEQGLGELARLVDESTDARQLEAAIVQLEKDCEFYVERRMNSGIRKAMAGHKVDEFE